jgi:hypothetical protein
MTNDSVVQTLNKAISEIKEHSFFDAHETLESIWYPRRFEESNEINLIRGLINAAVCLELLKRGKEEAGKKVWKNYLKQRPLLYKTTSPYLNIYHQMARDLESIKNTFFITAKV